MGLIYNTTGQSSNNRNILTQKLTAPKTTSGTLVLTQSYSYDSLNRLAGVSKDGGPSFSESFSYDRWGNMWVSGASGVSLSPHTPQSVNGFNQSTNRLSNQTGGFPNVQYDGAGNLKRDAVASTFSYDGESRQTRSTVNGVVVDYSYDGDGHRVKKVAGSVTTIFVYNVVGQLVAEYSSDPVPAAAGGGGTSYLTQDHLGSTRVVTRGDGSVKARYDYLPFGEELASSVGGRGGVTGYGSPDSTKQKFTSKERDTESGLDYFLARYYSSAQGRFTSADTVGGSMLNPQTLNLYSYVQNNPLRFIDPTGHKMLDPYGRSRLDYLGLGGDDGRDMAGGQNKKPTQTTLEFNSGVSERVAKRETTYADNGIGSVVQETMLVQAPPDQLSMGASLSNDPIVRAIVSKVDHTVINPVKNDGHRMVEGLFTWYGEQWLYGIITGGLGNIIQALRSVQRVERAFEAVTKWLGPESRVITNEAGDKVFLSKDGLRRLRADFNNPAPHRSPHLHVEEKINGKWVKSDPIYPKDVPPQ